MALSGIIILIILGFFLIFIEFFVVPGITVAGIGGVFLLIAGIWLSYSTYGITTGNYMLLSTFLLLIILLAFAFNSKTWKKISLKTQNTGKAKEESSLSVNIDDKGITISRLTPMGTIMINDKIYEAESKGIYIEENTEIVVLSININKIIVKPKGQ